jgi:hypothetical protein
VDGRNTPPYGYRKIGTGKQARLEIDPEKTHIITEMYTWYAGSGERLGLRGLIDKLHTLGVASPLGRPVWVVKSVRRVLTSEVYRGVLTWRGIPMPHPALRIVSDDIWQAA